LIAIWSELSVLKSLQTARLFGAISAFMVECHIAWGTLGDLTAPLMSAGFTVIDVG
jgi:hypothetical protein